MEKTTTLTVQIPRRAFCEADVPEGARSDPSGLGAEMLPPERCERLFAPCGDEILCPYRV